MLKSANMFGFFLMASLIMLSVSAALTGNMNLFSNTAIAQGYDDKYYGDDSYSKYPNDNKKYECRTGRLKDSSS